MSDRSSLIFVTQILDPDDPVLGFATSWAHALAERCERVVVIANEVRAPVAGLEVRSLGKEEGARRLARVARYLTVLNRLGSEHQWAGVLAHMCPSYLVAAAPVARLRSIPLWLWYAHPSLTTQLRVAHRLAAGVLTSLPGSYPLPSPKVWVIGQATDMDAFPLQPQLEPRPPLRLVAIGRSSPSKGLPAIVDAVARARSHGTDLRLRIVAPATTPKEREHRVEIARHIEAEGVSDITTLQDGVPPAEIPSLLRESHALVNNTASGSGDKAVLEAMATGRPVLVSNPSFRELLARLSPSPTFPPNDAAVLARRIEELDAATTGELVVLGAELRRRVSSNHSLDHWADAVVGTIGKCASRR